MSFARHADKACRFFSHADQSDFPTGGPHFDSIQPRPGETKMRVTWAPRAFQQTDTDPALAFDRQWFDVYRALFFA